MAEAAETEGVLAAAEAETDNQAGEEDSPEMIRIAKVMGWKEKEKREQDGREYLTPSQFVAKFSQAMRGANKNAERLQGQVNRMAAQIAKLSDNQRQQIDDKLDAMLDEAVEKGDVEAARKIRAQMKAIAAQAAPVTEDPAIASFKDRNPWFNDNKRATAYVHAVDAELTEEAGGPDKIKNLDAHMRKIEAAVKEAFPKLFGDAANDKGRDAKDDDEDDKPRQRAPLVSRGGRTASVRTGDLKVSDLTPKQREAAKVSGVTPERYVEELNRWNKQQEAKAG